MNSQYFSVNAATASPGSCADACFAESGPLVALLEGQVAASFDPVSGFWSLLSARVLWGIWGSAVYFYFKSKGPQE